MYAYIYNSAAFARIVLLTFVNGRAIREFGDSPTSHQHANAHVGLHLKCPILLSDINKNQTVLTNFDKTIKYQIS